jgi:hypothetical protein
VSERVGSKYRAVNKIVIRNDRNDSVRIRLGRVCVVALVPESRVRNGSDQRGAGARRLSHSTLEQQGCRDSSSESHLVPGNSDLLKGNGGKCCM